jgi:hypothetical protein
MCDRVKRRTGCRDVFPVQGRGGKEETCREGRDSLLCVAVYEYSYMSISNSFYERWI